MNSTPDPVRKSIKLSDLPTRKIVVEEPITEELRASMLAKSEKDATARELEYRKQKAKDAGQNINVDGTLSAPIYIDTPMHCDVNVSHC